MKSIYLAGTLKRETTNIRIRMAERMLPAKRLLRRMKLSPTPLRFYL